MVRSESAASTLDIESQRLCDLHDRLRVAVGAVTRLQQEIAAQSLIVQELVAQAERREVAA